MMSQIELRRRARFMAAEMLVSDVEAMGMDVASYTQDGSDEETAALTGALLRVADMIRAPLPAGYKIDQDNLNGRCLADGNPAEGTG
jgi:hypothetical protein